MAGLAWLAFVLRLDAVVSPFGSGLIYLTTSSRISHALSRSGYVPQQFERTHERTLVPVFGVLFSTAIGLLFLLPFPSWGKLVGIVTSASVLMYASAPLALGALRKSRPDLRARLPPAGRRRARAARVRVRHLDHVLVRLADADHADGGDARRLRAGRGLVRAGPQPGRRPGSSGAPRSGSRRTSSAMLVISYFGGFGPGGIIGGVGIFKHVLDHGGNNDLGLVGGLVASAAWSLVIYRLAIALRLSGPADRPARSARAAGSPMPVGALGA